jgi:uncharacterized membrane protein
VTRSARRVAAAIVRSAPSTRAADWGFTPGAMKTTPVTLVSLACVRHCPIAARWLFGAAHKMARSDVVVGTTSATSRRSFTRQV